MNILSFVGVLVVLSLLSWPLTLGVLVLVPPLLVATVWFGRRSARAYAHARETISTVNAEFQESISGVRESQAYVREERNIDSFRTTASRYLDARIAHAGGSRRSTSRSSCSSPRAATRSCSGSAARSCTTAPSPPAP